MTKTILIGETWAICHDHIRMIGGVVSDYVVITENSTADEIYKIGLGFKDIKVLGDPSIHWSVWNKIQLFRGRG